MYPRVYPPTHKRYAKRKRGICVYSKASHWNACADNERLTRNRTHRGAAVLRQDKTDECERKVDHTVPQQEPERSLSLAAREREAPRVRAHVASAKSTLRYRP